jgi:hypothetical protein
VLLGAIGGSIFGQGHQKFFVFSIGPVVPILENDLSNHSERTTDSADSPLFPFVVIESFVTFPTVTEIVFEAGMIDPGPIDKLYELGPLIGDPMAYIWETRGP